MVAVPTSKITIIRYIDLCKVFYTPDCSSQFEIHDVEEHSDLVHGRKQLGLGYKNTLLLSAFLQEIAKGTLKVIT